MPTFDIVSKVDQAEIRNAVDQARRELATRFDFKNTASSIDHTDLEITLQSETEDRLRALAQLLEEKLVKRKVSLKALEYGKIQEAAKGAARQVVTLKAGLTQDNTRAINKWVKDKAPKGIQSSTQGDQVRITGKKRDDLQAVIAGLKDQDFGLPLQFENFRD